MPEIMSSFREFLRQSLRQTSQSLRGVEHRVELLSEIVLLLANYQEEGTSLYPVIFVSDSKERLMQVMQGREAIQIGHGPNARETFTRAFKNCAPLAEDRQWAVYMEAEGNHISYGIFRSDTSPLSPTVFERLRHLKTDNGCIIGLTRLGGNFVEIRSSFGDYQYINVSGTQEEDYHPARVIRAFVDGVSIDADPAIKGMLQSFYYRLGMDVLHGLHGSLIAIQKKGHERPAFLLDGIHLSPHIKVAEAISAIAADPANREPYLRLISYSQLLRKLTWMDGITLLDTEGGILGYNCFVRNSEPNPEERILGGARRRAFEMMQRHVPDQLTGAFYKSQDGIIKFKDCSD